MPSSRLLRRRSRCHPLLPTTSARAFMMIPALATARSLSPPPAEPTGPRARLRGSSMTPTGSPKNARWPSTTLSCPRLSTARACSPAAGRPCGVRGRDLLRPALRIARDGQPRVGVGVERRALLLAQLDGIPKPSVTMAASSGGATSSGAWMLAALAVHGGPPVGGDDRALIRRHAQAPRAVLRPGRRRRPLRRLSQTAPGAAGTVGRL